MLFKCYVPFTEQTVISVIKHTPFNMNISFVAIFFIFVCD